jgi:arsenate reductase
VSAKPEILFLCVHNAGRSQIAAAFAKALGAGRVIVSAAGSEPADMLNPAVVEAMREAGIDLADEQPTRFTDEMGQRADVIVTMGCGDSCPVYPGKRYVDWQVPDPAGQSVEVVRDIRDDLRSRVLELLGELLDRGDDARG